MTELTSKGRVAGVKPVHDQEALRRFAASCTPDIVAMLGFSSIATCRAYLVDQFRSLPQEALALAYWDGDTIRGLVDIRSLPWDSRIYGMQMGRIKWLLAGAGGWQDREVKRQLVQKLIEQAAEMGYRHITARLPAGDHESHHALEDAGFQVMDIQLTMACSVKGYKGSASDWQAMEEIRPEDIEHITMISGTAYADSGLFADPHLPRCATEDLYRQWAENDCRGRADKVLVVRLRDRPIGYIACLLRPAQEEYDLAPYGVIDLIAVRPDFRGQGIGFRLVLAALDWFQKHVEKVLVRTQITNIAALSLYQKAGFRFDQALISLHWRSDGL